MNLLLKVQKKKSYNKQIINFTVIFGIPLEYQAANMLHTCVPWLLGASMNISHPL